MSKGWIKLHRQIMDHPFYTEDRIFSRYEAWEFLLLSANHADAKIMIDGQLVTVERGSLITSIRKLQERWKWSNTKVSRFLDVLQSEGMATVKSDTKKTVISIDKYGFYQGTDDEETTPKRRESDAEATQKHTNKNVKNEKNEKKGDIETSSRQRKTYAEDDRYFQMAVYFFNKLQSFVSKLGKAHLIQNANMQTWADDFRKIIEIDKRPTEELKSVIEWATNDPFWQGNILSPGKLREKYTKLCLKMTQEQSGRGWSESGQGSIRHGSTTQKSAADSVTGGQLGWLNRDKRKVVPMREVQGSDWLPR